MLPATLRKNTLESLGLLAERYPNMPLGRLLDLAVSASGGDLFNVSDVDLARGLNQVFVSLTQFEAAGIKL